MISLSLLFNKLAGLYGILALVTGYSLSFLQLSMYIYSLAALVLLCLLMSHIQKGSPLEMVALAWFYFIDTMLNGAYTAYFAISWFLTLSSAAVGKDANVLGAEIMSGTAGFRDADVNKAIDGAVPSASGEQSLTNAVAFTESVPSVLLIVFFNAVRVYFAIVLFSYARQVLRQYISSKASQRTHLHMDGVADDLDGPFPEGSPLGGGWKGKLGRMMTSVGKDWWLAGSREDEEWARNASKKFVTPKELPGTTLREQRARSGTGPPPMRIHTHTPGHSLG